MLPKPLAISSATTRRVVIVIYPGVQSLDITGPHEVFAMANMLLAEAAHQAAEPAYSLEIVAREAGPITMSSGLQIVAQTPLASVLAPIDTLIVAGGVGVMEAIQEPELVNWLRGMLGCVRRLASVCTGAVLLAEAGLLSGRRATTHWEVCQLLAKRYPEVNVEPDAIFIKDHPIWTSAGVTAGIDLALAMVEEDQGRDLALAIARRLVLYLKRPGGQSQFSAQLATQLAASEPIRDLQMWLTEHPAEDLSIPTLARRVGMSERNFARVFTREVGVTPGRYIEYARLDAARRQLEETQSSVDAIASACGFGCAETMRRMFLKHLRVSPSDYRRRFRKSALVTASARMAQWPLHTGQQDESDDRNLTI